MSTVLISASWWPETEEEDAFRRAALLPPREYEIRPKGRLFLGNFWARDGGRTGLLVGHARMVLDPGDKPWIDRIALLPEYRDEGIEERLMEALLDVYALMDVKGTVLVGPARAPVDVTARAEAMSRLVRILSLSRE